MTFQESQQDIAERDVFDLMATLSRLKDTAPELLAVRLTDLVNAQASLARLVLVVRNRRAA